MSKSYYTIANAPGIGGRRPYHMGVFIGRFQPFHNAHLHVINEALKAADNLLVLIGSADQPRDYFNPFSYKERADMIRASLSSDIADRVVCRSLVDYLYNDEIWIKQVQEKVNEGLREFGLDPSARVALVGHQKDGTSYYLKKFPQFASVGVPNYGEISATPIREKYFLDETFDPFTAPVPEAVARMLCDFRNGPVYTQIRDEYEFIRQYKKAYENLPYPPIFVTVDAVVVQAGHILLVQRRARPGRGLWALPGGFLNASVRIEDAVYRELREETKIKVPEPVLRGSTITSRCFDAVHRSARGRTITHAFLIHLKGGTDLPKVKGSDDAAKARWFPLAEVKRNMMFEDHYAIISAMVSIL